MRATPAIRNMIRDEKTHQIDSAIASGGPQGMCTMDQSLFNLVAQGVVAKDVALQHSVYQEALQHRFDVEGI